MLSTLLDVLHTNVGAEVPSIVQQASQGGVDVVWIIGIFVTILTAVLSAMGAILWKTYAMTKEWDSVLEGGDGSEARDGFISRSEAHHKELSDNHDELYEQMLVQGQLLSELSYAFSDIAEELEDTDNIQIDVNLDRIERLRKRKENRRDESE